MPDAASAARWPPVAPPMRSPNPNDASVAGNARAEPRHASAELARVRLGQRAGDGAVAECRPVEAFEQLRLTAGRAHEQHRRLGRSLTELELQAAPRQVPLGGPEAVSHGRQPPCRGRDGMFQASAASKVRRSVGGGGSHGTLYIGCLRIIARTVAVASRLQRRHLIVI